MDPNEFPNKHRSFTISEILGEYPGDCIPLTIRRQIRQLYENHNHNAVTRVMDKAKDVYRGEVESRKQQQFERYSMENKVAPDQLPANVIRLLTNRATAGAGKKKREFLLEELEKLASLSETERKEVLTFLINVLQANYTMVRQIQELQEALRSIESRNRTLEHEVAQSKKPEEPGRGYDDVPMGFNLTSQARPSFLHPLPGIKGNTADLGSNNVSEISNIDDVEMEQHINLRENRIEHFNPSLQAAH